jgi:uncharacterized protein (TIGR02722 family)
MKGSLLLLTTVVTILAVTPGCKTTVERVGAEETIDLSGRWNDTDSQLVSAEMVADLASRPWIEEYTSKTGKKPVVIVGNIRNKSSEHIETETFTKDLERELINSGRLKFVANSVERGELRQERKEQQTWSREETQKRLAAETGADFMLQGSIKSIVDQEGKEQVIFYQIDLEMVQLESNEKVWIGNKKIKKHIKRSRHKW